MQIENNYIDLAIQAALLAGKEIMKIYKSEEFDVTKKADDSPLTIADRNAHGIIASLLEQTGIDILSEEGKDIPYEERKDWKRFWLVDPLDGTKEFIKRNGEFTVNIALIEEGAPMLGIVFAPVLDKLYVGIVGEGAWELDTRGLILEAGKEVSIDGIRERGATLPLSTEHHSQTQMHSAYRVVASRSHRNADTEAYLEKLKEEKGELEIVSKGSSLKLCMIATGEADEYPRLGPTMEWDTAAAHALVKGMGKEVRIFDSESELRYNKPDLLNPYFLVK